MYVYLNKNLVLVSSIAIVFQPLGCPMCSDRSRITSAICSCKALPEFILSSRSNGIQHMLLVHV